MVVSLLVGWRPSLLGWRPSLAGWRPSLLYRLESMTGVGLDTAHLLSSPLRCCGGRGGGSDCHSLVAVVVGVVTVLLFLYF